MEKGKEARKERKVRGEDGGERRGEGKAETETLGKSQRERRELCFSSSRNT